MNLVTFSTPAEKAAGLQHRPAIDPDTLWLFTGVAPGHTFHTRNVPETIDIAFLAEDMRVIKVLTVPPNRSGLVAPPGTVAALESASGIMALHGIEAGVSLDPGILSS